MASISLARGLAAQLGVRTSLEDFDVDINVGTMDPTDHDETGAPISPVSDAGEPTAEAAQVEVAEEEAKSDAMVEEADKTASDVETLESIYIAMAGSLDQGGLTTQSFEMMNITVDHILNPYGIGAGQLFPSMESFGNDRYSNTVVSMEKVEGGIKGFGNTIMNLLKKIWFEIKRFVFNLIQVFKPALDKRAAAIEKACGNYKNSAKPEPIKVFAAQKLAKNYGGSGEGKVATASEITYGLKTLASVLRKANTGAPMVASKLVDVAAGKSTEFANKTDYIESYLGDVQADLKPEEKGNNKIAKLPFGDSQLVVVMDNVDGAKKYKGIKIQKGEGLKIDDGMKQYEAMPLKVEEIKNIASQVRITMVEVAKANELFKRSDIEKQISNMDATKQRADMATKSTNDTLAEKDAQYDKSSFQAAKDGVSGAYDKVKGALTPNDASVLAKDVINVVGKLSSYTSSSCKAALDFCAQSLKTHEKVDPNKKDEIPDAKEPAKTGEATTA